MSPAGTPARWLGSLCLLAGGLLAGLLIGEAVFRFLIPSRDLTAVSAWKGRCWRVDTLGYRQQPPATDNPDARRIVVIGDSFAVGLGVCDPADTFGWQLATQLERHTPGAFRVSVLAKSGIDSRDELALLRRLPQTPHIVVLSYFGNDIDSSARDAGLPDPPVINVYSGLAPPIRSLVTSSSAANFAYWSFWRMDYGPMLEHYRRVWTHQQVVAAHLRELEAFALPGSRLIVVVFPYLPDLARYGYARIVADHLRSRGAVVLNVEDFVGDLPAEARVVGPNDPHASVEVHHRIGRALYRAVLPESR